MLDPEKSNQKEQRYNENASLLMMLSAAGTQDAAAGGAVLPVIVSVDSLTHSEHHCQLTDLYTHTLSPAVTDSAVTTVECVSFKPAHAE